MPKARRQLVREHVDQLIKNIRNARCIFTDQDARTAFTPKKVLLAILDAQTTYFYSDESKDSLIEEIVNLNRIGLKPRNRATIDELAGEVAEFLEMLVDQAWAEYDDFERTLVAQGVIYDNVVTIPLARFGNPGVGKSCSGPVSGE